MESYIRKNTELRKQEKSTIEQDLYKLMKNSVFGKTTENLRKQVDVKLVRSTEAGKLHKLITKPSFNRSVIFGEAGVLAAFHMHKSRLLLNRPVFLDLSKHLMYDSHYNHLKAQHGGRAELLYTDTDRLGLSDRIRWAGSQTSKMEVSFANIVLLHVFVKNIFSMALQL